MMGAFIKKAGGRKPGDMFAWGGATPPKGSMICNGELVAKTAAPKLYAAIGDTHANEGDLVGGLSAYFRLPGGNNMAFNTPVITAPYLGACYSKGDLYNDFVEQTERDPVQFRVLAALIGEMANRWANIKLPEPALQHGRCMYAYGIQAAGGLTATFNVRVGVGADTMGGDYFPGSTTYANTGPACYLEVEIHTNAYSAQVLSAIPYKNGVAGSDIKEALGWGEPAAALKLPVLICIDYDAMTWFVHNGSKAVSLGDFVKGYAGDVLPYFGSGGIDENGYNVFIHFLRGIAFGNPAIGQIIQRPAGYANVFGAENTRLTKGGSAAHTHTAEGTTLTISDIPGDVHVRQAIISGAGERFADSATVPDYYFQDMAGGGQPHAHTIQDADHLPPFNGVLWCVQYK